MPAWKIHNKWTRKLGISKKTKATEARITFEELIDIIDTIAEQLNPKFQEELKQSRKEYEKGEVGTIEDIRKILRGKEKSLA